MTQPKTPKASQCDPCGRMKFCVRAVWSSSCGDTNACCECLGDTECEECNQPCDKCGKIVPVDTLETVYKQTCKASMSGPAEYDEMEVCESCREADRHYSENESYYRAIANGWND